MHDANDGPNPSGRLQHTHEAVYGRRVRRCVDDATSRSPANSVYRNWKDNKKNSYRNETQITASQSHTSTDVRRKGVAARGDVLPRVVRWNTSSMRRLGPT